MSIIRVNTLRAGIDANYSALEESENEALVIGMRYALDYKAYLDPIKRMK